MNNSNPLIPQGSLLDQAPRGRSRFRIAFYSVAGFHVVFLGVILLIVGCNGDKSKVAENATPPADTTPPPPDLTTSAPPILPPVMPASNPPVMAPYVPPTPPPITQPPASAASEYVVLKGDIMATIAKNHGVTLKALQAANPNVVPTKLKVGEKLQIPAGGTAGSTAMTMGGGAALSPEGGEIYVVKSGDTLTKISKAQGVSLKALRTANALKTDAIKVGQKLKLPPKAVAPALEAPPVAAPAAVMPPPAPAIPMTPAAPGR